MSREQIITQLMEKHYGKIYQCLMNDARRLGAGPLLTETEDCIQEALLLLYDQWPKYEATENLPGWLYITALNTLKNRRRLYRAREKTVTASLDQDGAGQQAAQRLERMEHAQAARREWAQEGLQRIRQCLTQEEYDFLLAYFQGEGAVQAMARALNVSEASLWKKKQRLIQKIKHQLFHVMLTIILSGCMPFVTLINEGNMGGESAGHPPGEAGPQPETPLSAESAAVVAEFLRSLPADVFDERCLRLLCLCNQITDSQFGKDPVDVEARCV